MNWLILEGSLLLVGLGDEQKLNDCVRLPKKIHTQSTFLQFFLLGGGSQSLEGLQVRLVKYTTLRNVAMTSISLASDVKGKGATERLAARPTVSWLSCWDFLAMEAIKLTPFGGGLVRETVRKQLFLKRTEHFRFLRNYNFHFGCRFRFIDFTSYIFIIFMIHIFSLPSSHLRLFPCEIRVSNLFVPRRVKPIAFWPTV